MRTELHFHLLPAVDDGPRDAREALALARLAVEDGTRRVVATPHVRELDLHELPARVYRLRAMLTDAAVPLQVFGGGEISPHDVSDLGRDELELIAQGPPEARWLLLEAPLWPEPLALSTAADELRARGYGLVIGHPERSGAVTLEHLRAHVEQGSTLQINASSLAGVHGAAAAEAARSIAKSGLPFVLASDAHSPSRPPLLTAGASALRAAGVAAETIRLAVDTGPASLFETGRLGSPRRHPGVDTQRRAA